MLYFPRMTVEQTEEKASAVIRQLEGCTVAEARTILRTAERMLDGSVVHECDVRTRMEIGQEC